MFEFEVICLWVTGYCLLCCSYGVLLVAYLFEFCGGFGLLVLISCCELLVGCCLLRCLCLLFGLLYCWFDDDLRLIMLRG